jgi:lysophospholipase L1-like esterase
LLADTVATNSKVKFILCEPFILPGKNTSPRWEEWQPKFRQARETVAKLAEKYHAPVVHFQKMFDDAAKRGAPADYWIWDGVHPTYSGHQLMADEWIRVYNEFYGLPLNDPARNSAIAPLPKIENDFYDWYVRHREVLELQKKIQPDVVMIGDSITHMWGGEPVANRLNGPKAWKETFGERKVLNLGFGWDRTQNVLWRLEHGEMDGLSPKLIVLNIGCNNFTPTTNARANSPEEIAVGIQLICKELLAKSPSSRIVVMGVFPRGNNGNDSFRAQIKKLNSILAADIAGKGSVTFLDIGEKFQESDGSISKEILSDGIHPTEKGYEIWGKALVSAGVLP